MSITLKSVVGGSAVLQVDGVDRLKVNADGTLEAVVSPSFTASGKQLTTAESVKAGLSNSSQVVYSTAGVFTFQVPDILKSGLKKPYVIVVGAGGGCPSFGATLSRGGAGGGSTEDLLNLSGVESVTVTVGAASNGAGGASSFGTYLTASGGQAGQSGSGNFSVGGLGSGGTINKQGGNGGGPDSSYSGEGGASPYATGVPRSGSGIPGNWPGGGAGAGGIAQNGAVGAVIIRW